MANAFNAELEIAAGLKQGDKGAHFDPHAVFKAKRKQLGAVAPHGAAHLGIGILQCGILARRLLHVTSREQ